MHFQTEIIQDTQDIGGILFPADIRYHQLLLTGPPGAGKSSVIKHIRGWPEEGFIDLSADGWWRMRHLSLRPREIHLIIPFRGLEQRVCVFEQAWRDAGEPVDVDTARIQIPPPKQWFFSVDWRNRYVFEFILRDPAEVFAARRERKSRYTHHVDADVTLQRVERQHQIYQKLACYFILNHLTVYLRDAFDGPPKRIILDQEVHHELAG